MFVLFGRSGVHGRARAALSAEHRPHARGELPRKEGLHDIVVRTGVKPRHPVGLVAPGGEKNHGESGRVGRGPEVLEPIQPRAVGKHPVKEHKVGAFPAESLLRLGDASRACGAEPLGFADKGNKLANGGFILNNQEERCGHGILQ